MELCLLMRPFVTLFGILVSAFHQVRCSDAQRAQKDGLPGRRVNLLDFSHTQITFETRVGGFLNTAHFG